MERPSALKICFMMITLIILINGIFVYLERTPQNMMGLALSICILVGFIIKEKLAWWLVRLLSIPSALMTILMVLPVIVILFVKTRGNLKTSKGFIIFFVGVCIMYITALIILFIKSGKDEVKNYFMDKKSE